MKRIDERRICANCGGATTYLHRIRGYEVWHIRNNQFWCHKCFNKTRMKEMLQKGIYKHKKYTKEEMRERNARRIRFQNKYPHLKINPRKYQCSICCNKIGDEYINCKGEIAKTKKIDLHHITYHDNDFLKDTIEMCASCHTKESRRMLKEKRKIEIKTL